MEQEIVVKMPSADKPGYYRRQLERGEIGKLEGADQINGITDWLVKHCEFDGVPEGVSKRDVILDLSRAQIRALFESENVEDSVPPENGG